MEEYSKIETRNILIVSALIIILGLFGFLLLNNKYYTVTFNTDGGNKIDSIVVKKNREIGNLPAAIKDNYIFEYWEYNDEIINEHYKVTKDIELLAKYKEIPKDSKVFKVRFKTNSDMIIPEQNIIENELVKIPIIPEKKGYSFVEWQLNGQRYDFDTPVNEDIVLIAIYEEVKTTTTIKKTTVKPITTNTKKATTTITTKKSTTTTTTTTTKKSTTTTPTTTKRKYTVKFNTDGGSTIPNQIVEEGKKVTKPSNPTKTGYILKEWTLNNKTYDFSSTVTSNIELKATYTNAYKCTFNGILKQGAEYVNGQYTYRYKEKYIYGSSWQDIDADGWGVILTDSNSSNPVTTKLCNTINNKPIAATSYMFAYSEATSIDLSSFDTSNVIDMSGMFASSKASELNLNNFDTSKVKRMAFMFSKAEAKLISLSGFNTSNVSDMEGMFIYTKVTSLDLSGFNTSNVTTMENMFGKSEMTTLNLNGFDTHNVISMRGMFESTKISNLDLSMFNTSNVTTMENMFHENQASSLDLSSFDTSAVTDMSWMFFRSQATSLDLSGFNTSNVTNMKGMFYLANAETGYARTQVDADRFNSTAPLSNGEPSNTLKPSSLTFVVK